MRTNLATWFAVIGIALLGSAALAQGTTVQLPTYSYFSAGSTVTVPDRGSAYLGGVNRASSSLNQSRVPLLPFSPFKNRAMGMDRSASHASVGVYIHDFEEMEEELLGRSRGGVANQLMPRDAGRANPLVARSRDAASTRTVASGRTTSPSERTPEEQTQAYLARARQLESEGKSNIALIYYRMASRRAEGELKQEIAARMLAIESRPETRVAQQSREAAPSQ